MTPDSAPTQLSLPLSLPAPDRATAGDRFGTRNREFKFDFYLATSLTLTMIGLDFDKSRMRRAISVMGWL